jgi:DNA-binding PadR family transcriptional regulator
MKVYVIQEILTKDNDLAGGAIVGVYTTRWLAQLALSELSKEKPKGEAVIYDVVTIVLDTFPIDMAEYERAIEGLIKAGFIDALVGEDGNFHYIPTELGKKEGAKLVKRLKRDNEKGGD